MSLTSHPDGEYVSFAYDALGRRIYKQYKKTFTNFAWDGNVPLHQWKTFTTQDVLTDQVITWVFEEDSYSPVAKLYNGKSFSIINDHLGTPIEMYDHDGNETWHRTLNANGKVLKETGNAGCPFLYQGQYYDNEIELAYNRFRYYSPEEGNYISQDPIGLAGGIELYAYVHDTNGWIDELGLSSYSQRRREREKGKHTRASEYPHGNSNEVREFIIKKHTNERGEVIDPVTKKVIPADKVTIEHKIPVVVHWNTKGRFQTKEQRARWYNKKSNLTVKERGPNSSEGAKMKIEFEQKTGKNYRK
jgi:RHS repeat-associated protein